MIHNSELVGLDEAECNWLLCSANLDGAIKLCQGMIENNYGSSYSHASVIMSLYHHGIELFLKYAIASQGISVQRFHYIRGLFNVYCEAFPEKEYTLDLPFIPCYLGQTDEEISENIKEEKKSPNKTDQMHRYHTKHDGVKWEGAHGFEPNSFLDISISLKSRFDEIKVIIEAKKGANDANK